MRDSIISILDFLSYAVVVIMALAGMLVGLASQNLLYVIVGTLGGFIAGAFMCGMWLVMSGIYWNTKKAELNTSRKDTTRKGE